MHEVTHHQNGFDRRDHHRHDEVSLATQVNCRDRYGQDGEKDQRPENTQEKRHRRNVSNVRIVMPIMFVARHFCGTHRCGNICFESVRLLERTQCHFL